jgi:hypothetical protein
MQAGVEFGSFDPHSFHVSEEVDNFGYWDIGGGIGKGK